MSKSQFQDNSQNQTGVYSSLWAVFIISTGLQRFKIVSVNHCLCWKYYQNTLLLPF